MRFASSLLFAVWMRDGRALRRTSHSFVCFFFSLLLSNSGFLWFWLVDTNLGSIVVQGLALLLHSSRVQVWSSAWVNACLEFWTIFRLFGFLPPPKDMSVGGLATMNSCPQDMNVHGLAIGIAYTVYSWLALCGRLRIHWQSDQDEWLMNNNLNQGHSQEFPKGSVPTARRLWV